MITPSGSEGFEGLENSEPGLLVIRDPAHRPHAHADWRGRPPPPRAGLGPCARGGGAYSGGVGSSPLLAGAPERLGGRALGGVGVAGSYAPPPPGLPPAQA